MYPHSMISTPSLQFHKIANSEEFYFYHAPLFLTLKWRENTGGLTKLECMECTLAGKDVDIAGKFRRPYINYTNQTCMKWVECNLPPVRRAGNPGGGRRDGGKRDFHSGWNREKLKKIRNISQ